jgi:predicted metalloprotease with PDZ domain
VLEELPFPIAVAGNYRYLEADVGGAALTLAIAGSWAFSDRELFDLICSIVRREIDLFGSAPHDSYLFVCDRNPVRGRDTFANFGVHFSRNMILLLDQRLDRSALYDSPMSIIAHEFFHNWNGGAIGASTDDFLWFTEGATVYYSYRVLLDVHVIVPDQYDSVRAAIARRFCDNPYREDVPVASAVNSDLTDREMVNLLYDGGFLAAEALDRRLDVLSDGRVRLIDVLRHLYDERGSGDDRMDDERLCGAIDELCGCDLTAFIAALVRTPGGSPLCDPSL